MKCSEERTLYQRQVCPSRNTYPLSAADVYVQQLIGPQPDGPPSEVKEYRSLGIITRLSLGSHYALQPVRPSSSSGFYPRHISSSRAHSNKIPTAIPIFSESVFSVVPLPVSRDVNIRQKSTMAVAKMKCTVLRLYGR